MNYYYDVYLNYQDVYYMFYEWDELDNVEFVKKIPLFHVNSKTIIDFLTKKVKVTEEFLKKIENKTKTKNNTYLRYCCIVSDGKNSLALEFDEFGISTYKSSLILDDEISINEFIYNVKEGVIDYMALESESIKSETRLDERVKKVLRLEIDNMYKSQNYSKLKYIYLEWFGIYLDNYKKMYENMIERIEGKLTEKEYLIYDLIKLSYNNV